MSCYIIIQCIILFIMILYNIGLQYKHNIVIILGKPPHESLLLREALNWGSIFSPKPAAIRRVIFCSISFALLK